MHVNAVAGNRPSHLPRALLHLAAPDVPAHSEDREQQHARDQRGDDADRWPGRWHG
jgi:hypothetical protein